LKKKKRTTMLDANGQHRRIAFQRDLFNSYICGGGGGTDSGGGGKAREERCDVAVVDCEFKQPTGEKVKNKKNIYNIKTPLAKGRGADIKISRARSRLDVFRRWRRESTGAMVPWVCCNGER
jgi:hypothetical protein